MDKRYLLAAAFLLLGLIHLLLPLYFTMTGLVLCALGAGTALATWLQRRGRALLHAALLAAMGSGVVLLLLLMSLIAAWGTADWAEAEEADYAILLGCQVQADNTPSAALACRIATAAQLLERNEALTLIVSGGKGTDEAISEAQCMYNTLVAQCPQWAERIVLEEQSTNTWENFQYSAQQIADLGGTDQAIVVITSEYHMARSIYLAGLQGLEVTAISSETTEYLFRFHYTLREVFAFVKAYALHG